MIFNDNEWDENHLRVHVCLASKVCSLAKAYHKSKMFNVLSALLALDKTSEIIEESNVFLMLQGSAEPHLQKSYLPLCLPGNPSGGQYKA